jgi:hypothetical protein
MDVECQKGLTSEALYDTINMSDNVSNTDADEARDWVTMPNGVHIPVDKEHNLLGKIGKLISGQSDPHQSKEHSRGGGGKPEKLTYRKGLAALKIGLVGKE